MMGFNFFYTTNVISTSVISCFTLRIAKFALNISYQRIKKNTNKKFNFSGKTQNDNFQIA